MLCRISRAGVPLWIHGMPDGDAVWAPFPPGGVGLAPGPVDNAGENLGTGKNKCLTCGEGEAKSSNFNWFRDGFGRPTPGDNWGQGWG